MGVLNMHEFNKFASMAKRAFDKPEYKSLLNGTTVSNVSTEVSKSVSMQSVLDKIINNSPLEQDDINQIRQTIDDFGFSEENNKIFMNTIQYNNPIHKGILKDLLLRNIYDTLAPFYPLQKYPSQQKDVYKIIQSWETVMLDILEKTRFAVGGATKRRKIKQSRQSKKLGRKYHTVKNKRR